MHRWLTWWASFCFVPLPAVFLLVLGGIMAFYNVAVETAKTIFYRQ